MNIIILIFSLFGTISFLSLFNSVEATEGIYGYLRELYRVPMYKCFQNILSAKYALIHVHNLNYLDRNSDLNIILARIAGFADIDIYLNPTVSSSSNPSQAIIKALEYLDENNAKFDRVWLLIWENQGWFNNIAKNVESIEKMVNTLIKRNQTYGIFTNRYNWISLTGNTTKFSDAPLLYSNHDGKKNFDDFYKNPFGGWEEPTMKRYICNNGSCGTYNICSLWKP
ncbi:hypothetical protein ACQ4LE_010244 [Meloidogyne hapla]